MTSSIGRNKKRMLSSSTLSHPLLDFDHSSLNNNNDNMVINNNNNLVRNKPSSRIRFQSQSYFDQDWLHFFLNGQIPASFSLISYFSHYYFNNANYKKERYCAWDSNPGLKDGWRSQNHRAMADAPRLVKVIF